MSLKEETDSELCIQSEEVTMDTSQPNVAKAQQDESVLDLVFAMDCTGSMGSYIDQARKVTKDNFIHYNIFWTHFSVV